MLKTIIRKLFVINEYFTIAIKKREGNIMDKLQFPSAFTAPATREEWCADPFLAEDGTHTFLFYEKVHGDLGSIEVVEVQPDCKLSEPKVLFSGETHWSYPYVFKKDGNWYMIPESSAMNEVSLYIAEEFPYHWKKESVLLPKAAVDTTVFQSADQWHLLTFIPESGSERVTPYAYRLNGTKLEPMKWDEYDPLCVRGAGSPFLYQGSLIRPVQVSTDQKYGNCVAFVKVEINGDTYHETVVNELTPEHVKAKGQFFDGLHTYCFSDQFEVIDIRCGKLSFWKPFKRFASYLSRR